MTGLYTVLCISIQRSLRFLSSSHTAMTRAMAVQDRGVKKRTEKDSFIRKKSRMSSLRCHSLQREQWLSA